jgi:hypothetical protein
MGLGFCFCWTSNRSPPNLLRLRVSQSTEHKLIRVSPSLPRNPGRRHPHLPCFYPHSIWATSGPRWRSEAPRGVYEGTESFAGDACYRKPGYLHLAQPAEPPYADPHVRWCGRGEWATTPPMPICESLPTPSQLFWRDSMGTKRSRSLNSGIAVDSGWCGGPAVIA